LTNVIYESNSIQFYSFMGVNGFTYLMGMIECNLVLYVLCVDVSNGCVP